MRRAFGNSFAVVPTLFVLVMLSSVSVYLLHAGSPPAQRAAQGQTYTVVPAISPFIDVHSHPQGAQGRDVGLSLEKAQLAVDNAINTSMAMQNEVSLLFLPPPMMLGDPATFDGEVIRDAEAKYPGRLAFLSGGGTLNEWLQESVKTGDTGPEVQKKFRERAEEIAKTGAVGFGEMAGEHLPRGGAGIEGYEHAPLDNPLYFILADVAAKHNMVIDIHMEAVPMDMPYPPGTLWAKMNPAPNPPILKENISGLERLLDHNKKAKIMWDHAAWDHSGYRTVDLTRRLLMVHPNLYMSIKCDYGDPGVNWMVDPVKGPIKPEWLALLKEFPDRFTLGADQSYPIQRPGVGPIPRWQATIFFFNQLPPDLRQKIGLDNPIRIYGLKNKIKVSLSLMNQKAKTETASR